MRVATNLLHFALVAIRFICARFSYFEIITAAGEGAGNFRGKVHPIIKLSKSSR